MTRFKRLTILSAVVLLAAGCSQSPETKPSAATSVPVATSAAPSPSPSPKPPAKKATFYFRHAGYYADVTIWQWPMEPAANTGNGLGIGCGVNSETDVVVPIKIRLTNMTRETLELALEWNAMRPLGADIETVQLLTESRHTSTGATCHYEKKRESEELKATLSLNGYTEMQVFLIARHYVANGKPRPEHLQHALIIPTEIMVTGVQEPLQQFSANDNALRFQNEALWALPWNPANKNGGCLMSGKGCS